MAPRALPGAVDVPGAPLESEERDPFASAGCSDAADPRAASHATLEGGDAGHAFGTLLESVGSIVRNTHQHHETCAGLTLEPIPQPHQQRTLELVETIEP